MAPQTDAAANPVEYQYLSNHGPYFGLTVSLNDTNGGRPVSSTHDLVKVLKAELRRAGITYAELARALGLAESTVKRIFAKSDMPLSRVDQVLAVLGLDFGEFARQLATARPARLELTVEQEQAVVADPKLLLVAICAMSEWTATQIEDGYRLNPAEVVAALTALDRLGILELRPHNRYRLKIDKTFRWRPDGPVMRFFRAHAVADYFAGGFAGEGELLMLVHGELSTAHAQTFNERLQRLGQDFAQQHQADRLLPEAEREPFTMLVGLRSWVFGPFRELRRRAAR